jgi:hypothetical protein
VVSGAGAVNQFEPLSLADEHHRVLSRDIATAKRLNADRTVGASTDFPCAFDHEVIGERLISAGRHGFGEMK